MRCAALSDLPVEHMHKLRRRSCGWHIIVTEVPASLAQLPADKAAPIVVLCASGHRGAFIQMHLQFLGYTNIRSLNGGMNAWAGAELPVSTAG